MTFNIRFENPNDGINSFENRKDLIKKFIQREMPDVIGFQEMVDNQRNWFEENLYDYNLIGTGRDPDYRGEGVCIAYNKHKFSLVRFEQFSMSPTPDIPGSRFPLDQSGCPRPCVIATLVSKKDGTAFRFASTHLDHYGKIARVCGAAMLMTKLTSITSCPYILVGDFNEFPDGDAIKEILGVEGVNELTDPISASDATFHRFGNVDRDYKIDYIFSNAEAAKNTLKIHTDNENGIWLSDHYPISVTVNI